MLYTVLATRLVVSVVLVLAVAGCGGETEASGTAEIATSQAAPAESETQLACAVTDSDVWTTDQSEPPLGVEPEEALTLFEAWNPQYIDATIVDRASGLVTATVERNGSRLAVLSITKWRNGSWSVEGGSYCDGAGVALG